MVNFRLTWIAPVIAVIGAAGLLAGCSDSSGSRPNPPASSGSPPASPPPAGGGGPTWTQGVFQSAAIFKDRCQVVRTGVDIEGNAFPDRSGTALEERFWLRSWTNETYLWNTEVVDQNPAAFSDRLSYFAVLKTNALTPSGREKDDFHFSQPTDEFLRQRNSTPRAGYGARFAILSATAPRDVRVLYTEPASPASLVVGATANLIRGARILQVDGLDLINAGSSPAELDTLNNGLFPRTAGETHVFVVQDPDGTERTVTLTSVNLAPKPVNRFSVIDTPGGKVGYMLVNTFSPFASERDIAEAVAALKGAGINDLVLDLRYNGGGLLAVASQLSYMIAGSGRTSGRAFERLRFNASAGSRNPVTGQINDPVPFYSTGLGFTLANGSPLQTLSLPRVFVLTTGQTCSASEAIINGLRGIFVDVILIGDTTCGKPFGFFPTDNCGETYFTIQFQGTNDLNFGDYADGFIPNNSPAAFGVRAPGCVVNDDLARELGDVDEAMLAAALLFRATGACPTPPASAARGRALVLEGALTLTGPGPAIDIMETNRDMRLPN